MTQQLATDLRDALSLLLGEVVRVKLAIRQGEFSCDKEYAELVENTFMNLRDLVHETHTLFCGEAS